MPPRNRRIRQQDRYAAPPPTTSTEGKAGSGKQDVFHFVSVNPSSEVQKSHNRTVIRSHASKYIWRQHRATRVDKVNGKKSCKRTESLASPRLAESLQEEAWSASPFTDVKDDEPQSAESSPTEPEEPSAGDVGPKEEDSTKSSEEPPPVPVRYVDNRLLLSPANNGSGTDEGSSSGRPFNQLISWFGDPTGNDTCPSMLGDSAISKLMHYAVYDLWPGLALGASNRKWSREDAAQSWLPHAWSNPALFTAFLYGAAGHLQTRKRLESAQFVPQTREEKLEQIICEGETVKRLSLMIKDQSLACSDEVILAVLCMAFNRADYSGWNVSDPWPKAPLRNLQWLDVYGGLSLNDKHVQGLMALIQAKGGLSQVTLPGLAEILSTSAIMLSAKSLAKPRLPFVPIFQETANGQTPNWPSVARPVGINLETTDPIAKASLPDDLKDVLHNMRDYNTVINLYSQGLIPQLELAVIADRRNYIQFTLISLPSIREIHGQFIKTHRTYEPTRLAAMVYSLLIIFPLPAANRPFPRLAMMMANALSEPDVNPLTSSLWQGSRELLLWVLVVGGMAAKHTPHREWFANTLGEAIRNPDGSVSTWEDVKAVLTGIMWMDSVCDMGGQAVWTDAMMKQEE